jgi:hypothetical protein
VRCSPEHAAPASTWLVSNLLSWYTHRKFYLCLVFLRLRPLRVCFKAIPYPRPLDAGFQPRTLCCLDETRLVWRQVFWWIKWQRSRIDPSSAPHCHILDPEVGASSLSRFVASYRVSDVAYWWPLLIRCSWWERHSQCTAAHIHGQSGPATQWQQNRPNRQNEGTSWWNLQTGEMLSIWR